MHLLEIHVIISHGRMYVFGAGMMRVVGSDLRPRGCGDRLCGGRHCVEASLRELLVFFCVDWLLFYVDLVYGIMIYLVLLFLSGHRVSLKVRRRSDSC